MPLLASPLLSGMIGYARGSVDGALLCLTRPRTASSLVPGYVINPILQMRPEFLEWDNGSRITRVCVCVPYLTSSDMTLPKVSCKNEILIVALGTRGPPALL
ncbi:hypothetical protein EDD37DRAFT_620765, partial [Exophiala viscosa]|uniref:uncharacterized protein n=1 Tax=Exophiala viscosa TaxID=2486360 RepID=UPI00218E6FFD